MRRRAVAARKRGIAAFDIDGTLLRTSSLPLTMHEGMNDGLFPQQFRRELDELDERRELRRITFDQYERGLISLFFRIAEGRERAVMDMAAKLVAERHRDRLYHFTRTLLTRLRRTHDCIAITGSFEETMRILGPHWGFTDFYASRLATNPDGTIAGDDPNQPVTKKGEVLDAHVARVGASLRNSVGIGDTKSDIAMLERVALPIAFNPSDDLATAAEKHGWTMVSERKNNVYVHFGVDRYRRFSYDRVDEAVTFVLNRCDGKIKPKRR